MKGILYKKDISWIAKQTVIGNAYFLLGSLGLMYCLGHVIADLYYLVLGSFIGFSSAIVIINSRRSAALGEPVGVFYLLLALIEASSVLFFALYLYLHHL